MLLKIKKIYDTLTDAEARIADVLLKNPLSAVQKNVKEIAQQASAAPSAVIRFCKKMGFDGFTDLKASLVADIVNKEDTLLPVKEDDSTKTLFEDVFRSGMQALKDTLKLIDFEKTEEISTLFTKAKRIVFFGVGTSSVIAIDAHYRFSQLGISSSYCSDILFMNVTAANLTKDDVAVGISHSGRTKATVDAMRLAKKSGAKTVAITSYEQSLLSKECDYSVIAFSDEKKYPVEAVSASVAHMCIIEAFMMSIAKLKYVNLPEYIENRNSILKNMRY